MILVLLDLRSGVKFGAHISAAADTKRLPWLAMKTDLQLFFRGIDTELDQVACYLFSSNIHWHDDGSFEQRNVMRLLNSILPDDQLEALGSSTYLIEGEGGVQWNPYCSVRLDDVNLKHRMRISFVDPNRSFYS